MLRPGGRQWTRHLMKPTSSIVLASTVLNFIRRGSCLRPAAGANDNGRRASVTTGPVLKPALTLTLALTLALAHTPLLPSSRAYAAPQPADSRPYDTKLLRLAELLGAIHYLRELCGANEGQFWRDTMQELMKSEGSSAIRRARMTRGFNLGYRTYSRTYNVCTPSAKSAIDRFLIEGAEIADSLAAGKP